MLEVAEADLELGFVHPRACRIARRARRRETIGHAGLHDRLAHASCRKFFDELNDLGWDLQLQAHKVEREAHENEIKRDEKTIWISVSRGVTERRASRVGAVP
jgi:hypothetical protein